MEKKVTQTFKSEAGTLCNDLVRMESYCKSALAKRRSHKIFKFGRAWIGSCGYKAKILLNAVITRHYAINNEV